MKVGDKILCKLGTVNLDFVKPKLVKGNYYCIEEIVLDDENFENTQIKISDYYLDIFQVELYFYTKQELRKEKLNKIDESR